MEIELTYPTMLGAKAPDSRASRLPKAELARDSGLECYGKQVRGRIRDQTKVRAQYAGPTVPRRARGVVDRQRRVACWAFPKGRGEGA